MNETNYWLTQVRDVHTGFVGGSEGIIFKLDKDNNRDIFFPTDKENGVRLIKELLENGYIDLSLNYVYEIIPETGLLKPLKLNNTV